MRVAVPTHNSAGLEAERSDHFGHCDVFTVVDLDAEKEIVKVSSIENGENEAGGCMIPVQILADTGVETIVVGGMGARAMRGFAEAGIAVYFTDRSAVTTVTD